MAMEQNGAAPAETQIQQLPVPAKQQPVPYGPESYHPLMIRQDDKAGKGDYQDYVNMIKWMVDREVKTLGEYVQSGWYRSDWRRKSLVTKYYKLAQWQITSEAGRLNHDRGMLLKERTAIHSILTASGLPFVQAEDVDAEEVVFSYDEALYEGVLMMPLTAADAYSRVDWITEEVRRLSASINRAVRRRHFFDCGPLIEYFQTPADQRGAIDLMAIAPFFLRRLQVYIDISIADIWRLQAQRVIAQQSPEDDSELTEREARPKKRGLLSRFTG